MFGAGLLVALVPLRQLRSNNDGISGGELGASDAV